MRQAWRVVRQHHLIDFGGQYILKEMATGNIVLDKVMVSDYTAGMGDAFNAAKRLRLANEGSAKVNIGAFLEELSKVKVSSSNVTMSK